ncbi:MAG TPA: fumarate hydratase [Desulfobulbaceae bacterium]|nr:fumarate hydratase [Desulfobulbaceae bacterium]
MAETMEFIYQNPFPLDHDSTEYRFIEGSEQYITVKKFRDREFLVVRPEGLREIARLGMHEVNFFLRREHNESVAKILQDPLASANDREVALAMLRNAEISSQEILPVCQDTGTAIVMGKKGQQVWTDCNDAEELSAGIFATYTGEYLRYSQNAPLTMYDEVNTGTNLPAQIDIYATSGMEYRFLFVAKGGGSANKSYLYQETKALLNPDALKNYLVDKMKTLGTAACPPYHLAFVIGGTSAEATLKMVKLVSTHYYDDLPTSGNKYGRAFRDIELEQELLAASRELGIGAQFGGRYFAHDVRVVRLPRHGASCPIGMGVSCSADRNLKAKITKEGFWLEQLDHNPGRLIPEECRTKTNNKAVAVDLNQPMPQILAELTQHPVATQILLSGTIIVGRDIAHAKWKELLDAGKPLPEYLCNHPVYYAGPAKTPPGMPSGSFGPTTAGRMDPYVPLFQKLGGSMIMIAKGNRSQVVTDSCKEYGGFYLGSIGGPAALLAAKNITSVECLDFAELGMEAVWKIKVKNFPAFILVDDKGNDFFKNLM